MNEYVKLMLDGLRRSQICLDLDMWTEFILTIKKQGFGSTIDARIQKSAHALQIPIYGILNLPSYKEKLNSRITTAKFESAFKTAWNEVGPYVRLTKPNEDSVDIKAVSKHIKELEGKEAAIFSEAFLAAKDLLEDAHNIDQNVWRESQRIFCERVNWKQIGSRIFQVGQRTVSQNLGQRTLEYLKENFGDDVTNADERLLEPLPRVPSEDEIDFYYRWNERLGRLKAGSILKKWQARLFSKDLVGRDILSAIFNGFEEIIKSGVDFMNEAKEPRILIRSSHHNEELFWKGLDKDVLELFKFEARSVRKLLAPYIIFDIDACFNVENETESAHPDDRKIELEFCLMEQTEIENLSENTEPNVNAPRK